MASIDLKKYALKSYAQLSKHLDQEKRMELNHSNEHIDKNLTADNYWIGVKDFSEQIEKIKNRTLKVDRVKPPLRVKQDRVTAISFNIPCPLEIEKQGRADEFFQKAYEWMKEKYGAENLHGMTIHKDEKHEYYDSRTKSIRESLYHAHGVMSPYTEEKGINAKAFMTKSMMFDLQKSFDAYVYQEFGVQMLTHETPGRESVEALKLKSDIAGLEEKKRELFKEWNDVGLELQYKLEEYVKAFNDVSELEEKITTLKTQNEELEAQNRAFEEEAQKLVERANGLDHQLRDEEGFIQRYIHQHDTDEGFRKSQYISIGGREAYREDLRYKAKKLFHEVEIPRLAQERKEVIHKVHGLSL